jgi:hypothetical protein
MHYKYCLSKNKDGEWFTFDRKLGHYYSNPSKNKLMAQLRNLNESNYCRLRKNQFIVMIDVVPIV